MKKLTNEENIKLTKDINEEIQREQAQEVEVYDDDEEDDGWDN